MSNIFSEYENERDYINNANMNARFIKTPPVDYIYDERIKTVLDREKLGKDLIVIIEKYKDIYEELESMFEYADEDYKNSEEYILFDEPRSERIKELIINATGLYNNLHSPYFDDNEIIDMVRMLKGRYGLVDLWWSEKIIRKRRADPNDQIRDESYTL